MSKIGRSFTIDTKVWVWLEEYALKVNKKKSDIVNQALKERLEPIMAVWSCYKCDAENSIQFKKCWKCNTEKP